MACCDGLQPSHSATKGTSPLPSYKAAAHVFLREEGGWYQEDLDMEQSWLSACLWSTWAIPGISVHLSKTRCVVKVPILAQHIARYDWKALGVGMAEFANIAVAHFKSPSEWQRLANTGVTLETAVEHRKHELLELGGCRFLLPQCRSQRPAFVARIIDGEGNVLPLVNSTKRSKCFLVALSCL